MTVVARVQYAPSTRSLQPSRRWEAKLFETEKDGCQLICQRTHGSPSRRETNSASGIADVRETSAS